MNLQMGGGGGKGRTAFHPRFLHHWLQSSFYRGVQHQLLTLTSNDFLLRKISRMHYKEFQIPKAANYFQILGTHHSDIRSHRQNKNNDFILQFCFTRMLQKVCGKRDEKTYWRGRQHMEIVYMRGVPKTSWKVPNVEKSFVWISPCLRPNSLIF